MIENRFGMGSGPAIWQQLFQMLIIGMEVEKEVADVDPRFDAMALGARQDRIQHGRSWPRCFTAQEEPILPANGLMTKRPLADVVIDRKTTIFGEAT